MINNLLDLLWLAGAAVSLGFTIYGAFLGLALQRGASEPRTLSTVVRPCVS